MAMIFFDVFCEYMAVWCGTIHVIKWKHVLVFWCGCISAERVYLCACVIVIVRLRLWFFSASFVSPTVWTCTINAKTTTAAAATNSTT